MAVRGAPAIATKIEVDDVAQSIQSNAIVANRQLGCAPCVRLRQLCRRAEVLDTAAAIELQPNACLPSTIALSRSHHEGEIKPRVARAAIEVEPLGPRVLPHRRVRDLMTPVDLPEDVLRAGLRPRDIFRGVLPLGTR